MKSQEIFPLVSVVVPVYNVEDYLAPCVYSIIEQTYPNLEILLVNDGSTDRSGVLCDKLAEEDSRIRVFHTTNGGLSAARNYGTERSSGAYLVFVDSDDLIGASHIENLLCSLIGAEAQIAITGGIEFIDFDTLPEDVRAAHRPSEYRLLTSAEAINQAITPGVLPFSEHAWGKMYSAALKEDLVFPPGKHYEDTFIMHRILDVAERIVHENANDYYYRKKRGGSITQQNDRAFLDSIEACKVTLDYGRNVLPEIEDKATRRYYARLIEGYSRFCYSDQKDLEQEVFKMIKNERGRALLSSITLPTTRAAFALSLLGDSLFSKVAKWYFGYVERQNEQPIIH